MPEQLFQERLERLGIEFGGHGANEFAGLQADGSKTSDGLAGRCMDEHRVLVLWWYPHATACTVLLEVAFVQTPQFNVLSFGQTAQFF